MKPDSSPTSPPLAARKPDSRQYHGQTLVDEYRWLRADNWQQVMHEPQSLPADIRDYIEAENAYKEAFFDQYKDEKQKLVAEMRGRIKEDVTHPPRPDGNYAYGSRFLTGAQYPQIFRTRRQGGSEEILLDVNILAQDTQYYQPGTFAHAPNHNLIAYSYDDNGSEYFTINILDIATNTLLKDTISHCAGSIVWAADSAHIFYIKLDENHRPARVYCHKLGSNVADDILVYEENDPQFFVSIGKTQSGKFILIDAHDHQTSEIRMIDAHNPLTQAHIIAPRETGHEYSVEHHEEELIILTNQAGCEDFKIIRTPLAQMGRGQWQDLVEHTPGELILTLEVYEKYLVWMVRIDGLPQIMIYDFATAKTTSINYDEQCYALSLESMLEYNTDEIRFNYASPTTPRQLFSYHIPDAHRQLLHQQEVPSGHQASDYITRKLFATAEDGETIPISLLSHKDTPLNGSAPLLQYGYGAYGISIPAGFSTNILSLVDRGFVYAIAHIRGGKDKGYRWYKEGRMENKTNTFSDFITVTRFLIAEKIASSEAVIAQGGSAGGMLMGAIANKAPELYKAIIAEVPFVDVLNTMLDDSLPLTPPEWPEWGNPITSSKDFERIASYSPYDNVIAQAYPDIFAVAGLTDPRVTYWEAAKWIAKLRANATNDPFIMLATNMGAGHGGASGRFNRLEEVARNWIFALYAANKL